MSDRYLDNYSDNKNRSVWRVTGEQLVLLAFCILLLCTIINANEFAASMSATLIPVACVLALVFVFGKWKLKRLEECIRMLCVCLISVVTTAFSAVVKLDAMTVAFLLFAGLYILMGCMQLQDRTIKRILKFYAMVTLILSVCIIAKLVLSVDVVDGRVSLVFFGVRKDENYLAGYCTFGFVYYLAGAMKSTTGKLKKMLAALVVFAAIFLTGSRAGLLASLGAAGLLLAGMVLSRGISIKKFGVLLGIAVAAVIGYRFLLNTEVFARMTDTEGYADDPRLRIWGYAMEAFTTRPLFGNGIQSGSYYSMLHIGRATHSCFVDMLTTSGVVGVVLFVFEYLSFCRVKKGNLFFQLAVMCATFVPLFFVNGYESSTFWVAMLVCKLICKYCKEHDSADLLGMG